MDRCDLLCLDLPLAEEIRAAQPDAERIAAMASGADALGDPTRLAIALALERADELCVCDLAWIVARSDKLVSHHVRLLRQAGMAVSRRDGKMVMYSLTDAARALLIALEAAGRAPAVAPS